MIEDLNNWWNGLAPAAKIFYAIGVFASAFIVLQGMMMLFGFHGEDGSGLDGGAAHGDMDAHGDADAHFLSIRTVTAFLVGFGWIGALLTKVGLALWLVLPMAFLAGSALMLGVFYLMKLLWSLRASGTLDYRNAVGQIGSVYLPIPGERKGKGQIEVLIQGRLQTVQAMTSKPTRIENRAKVLVVDVLEDNTLLVIPEEEKLTLT